MYNSIEITCTELASIALALPKAKRSGSGWVACCPAHNDNEPSLSLSQTSEGKILWKCQAGCNQLSVGSALGLLKNNGRILHTPAASVAPEKKPNLVSLALETWENGTPVVSGDPVDRYLRRRAIRLTTFPSSLRFHPFLYHRNGAGEESHHPAMIAKIVDDDGSFKGIHRTYLTAQGEKASVDQAKKILGTLGFIRLFEPHESIGIAEGIETALSYNLLSGVPAWCAISANGIEKALVPPEVKRIYACVDLDASGRGETAAIELARRLFREGREAYLARPFTFETSSHKGNGYDWNDYLVEIEDSFYEQRK